MEIPYLLDQEEEQTKNSPTDPGNREKLCSLQAKTKRISNIIASLQTKEKNQFQIFQIH